MCDIFSQRDNNVVREIRLIYTNNIFMSVYTHINIHAHTQIFIKMTYYIELRAKWGTVGWMYSSKCCESVKIKISER